MCRAKRREAADAGNRNESAEADWVRPGEILKSRPFTIRLLDREDRDVQPTGYKCETGYQKIGISICSEKREFFSEKRTLLYGEKNGTMSAESTAAAAGTAK